MRVRLGIRRYIRAALACAVVIAVCCGCNISRTADAEQFGIYYINSKQTGLVKEKYTLASDTTSDCIRELLAMLSTEAVDDDFMSPIPQDLAKVDFELADGALVLHFAPGYAELTGTRELLARSAVSKTLLQLGEVSSVSFSILEEPLKDDSGNVVGAMTADSFLDTFGEREEALESDTFTLYYGTESGQGLMKKTRLLHFNNTMSRESVVLTYLAKSPESDDGARPVLASGTKVLSVTTKDGICYVKLDATFLSQQTGVATETAVYGIVNSLTSLDDIGKVELSIENSVEGVVPETDTVSGLYEANESLVVK